MAKIFLIFIIIGILNDIYTCCECRKYVSKKSEINKNKIPETQYLIVNLSCECRKYVSKESEINKNKISETQYLMDNLKDIEKVNKYIYIKNLYSDEVEDISGIRDITTEQILNNLGVKEAQNEIDKCWSINEKVGKIFEIISKDFNNNRFTFENSNLLVPRCLVIHEGNNCVLEASFSYLESNPYYCKFFWLLNNLFENGSLNTNELFITYEICKFFKNAINNPNFKNKISCINISKVFYNNLDKIENKLKEDVKKDFNEYINKHIFGSFQANKLLYYIYELFLEELNNYHELNKDDKIFEWCLSCYNPSILNIDEINNKNYEDYICLTKDGNKIFCYIFLAEKYHFYTIRNINNIWVSYDSLQYKQPTPISKKELAKIRLNCKYELENFNGAHSLYKVSLMAIIDKNFK